MPESEKTRETPSWLRYTPKPKQWKPGAKQRMGRQWNRRRKR